MTRTDQISLLKAQKRVIDGLLEVLAKPQPKGKPPVKHIAVVFCDALTQKNCMTCKERSMCIEWRNKGAV